MKQRRFTLRAIFAASLVVAIIAALIPTNAMPSASIPPIIWGAAVSIGLVCSGGRGRIYLVYSTIAGVLGSTAATAFIIVSPEMSFGNSWMGPVCTVVFGGIAGCVVGILVRLVMEGLVICRTKTTALHRES